MAPTLWGDIGLPFLVDIQYIMVQVLEVNKKERQGRRSHFMMGRSGSCFWGQWFGEVAKRPHMLQFNKCGKSDINGQVKPHRFMRLIPFTCAGEWDELGDRPGSGRTEVHEDHEGMSYDQA
ncbi:unnamed protein product [Durusdinium trenchii]|uniref:Uncharacterized protein n=1 Tax=Durusdinium trenchii TaxID=1381693 RepID=A0ABP0S9Q4_9DINO